MLEWTTAGDGPRFALFVHHTDAAREWAYDRESHIGRLDKGLDEATAKGWTVVSMKDDWKQVFPFEASSVTAINILLEPDETMLQRCEANNARLLKVFPKGFALDATHRPHVTLLQRFVRTADLDRIYSAAGKVLASADLRGYKAVFAPDLYVLPDDLAQRLSAYVKAGGVLVGDCRIGGRPDSCPHSEKAGRDK
jgi:hypothetical protein